MGLHVSNATIAVIVINLILTVAIPLGFAFLIKKKAGGTWKALGIGALTMFVFAFVVESAINSLVGASPFGKILTENLAVYAIYGGLMAGLFEETGRFVAFKFWLKKEREDDGNALMYGVGHGGIEVVVILGIGMINNLAYAIMINSGTADTILAALPADIAAQQSAVFEQLAAISAIALLAAPVERISAMIYHIAASLIVWFAVKKGGKATWLYPLAILLHMGLDAISIIMAKNITNVWLVELGVLVYSFVVVFIAVNIAKKYRRGAKAD